MLKKLALEGYHTTWTSSDIVLSHSMSGTMLRTQYGVRNLYVDYLSIVQNTGNNWYFGMANLMSRLKLTLVTPVSRDVI